MKAPGDIIVSTFIYQESAYMGDSSSTLGIGLLILGLLVVSEIISLVTGMYAHWPFVILGIVVGLMAVSSINR
jgi:hypothetical protein